MTTTTCPNHEPGCPGPAGYDVNNFPATICADCEIEAICSEPAKPLVVNEHGLVVCDHAACSRPAVTSGRCDWHQDLAEG